MMKLAAKIVMERQRVLAALARKRRVVLYRTGGYGRTVMRNSMPSRKATSSPGSPPNSKTRRIKKNIRFEVDLDAGTVVVAPEPFASRSGAKPHGGKTTLEVINEGGAETLVFPPRVLTDENGLPTEFVGETVRRATYEPRPFTDPARPAFEEKFAELVEAVDLR